MPKRSSRRTGSSQSYGESSQPPIHIALLSSTASGGNSSLPGRLGWEDGGKGCQAPQRCLRKVLGLSQVTDEELATTLVNIEAALNSRPITQDTEDALTPAHFLCGERLTKLPAGKEPQMERNITKAHQWQTTSGNAGKRNTF